MGFLENDEEVYLWKNSFSKVLYFATNAYILMRSVSKIYVLY